ncbi:MAG: ATP-binding cassette domain-containing protein [Ruminococcus sp.]|nr:ATP-binding cassette domain-containing protein [Ruminococcus sp.]
MDNSVAVKAQLVLIDSWKNVTVFNLVNDEYTLGRVGGANDIGILSEIVSSQHAMLSYENNTFCYIDLASTNGTYINDRFISGFNGQPSSPVYLNDGDIIRIGEESDRNKIIMIYSAFSYINMDWHTQQMSVGRNVSIGRSEENDIIIPDLKVSRKHAVINVLETGLTVTDNKSYNGTILNGESLNNTARFPNGSTLIIGNTRIYRINSILVYNVPAAVVDKRAHVSGGGPRGINERAQFDQGAPSRERVPAPASVEYPQDGVQVKVENVSKIVGCKRSENPSGKKKILNNISLTINPGELVAILGGSGSGKTTLMNCINGFEPATSGRILINGVDLYKNYQSLKSSIGYVPQQDIVYDNLTVRNMLRYACKLRLPNDISKDEIAKRVDDVIEMVDLKKQSDTYIKKLSGGQRKRASIAVELVSGPSLFFLDEPTSGLDPEAETNLMHRLKDLSTKNGKTIIVVTHTLQNIHLYDKIIFVAAGGELCYFGSPENAKAFFEVDNISDAYEKISRDKSLYINRYQSLTKEGMKL